MATIDWGDLVAVQPSEVIETRMPLVVEYSRLEADSGGAGTSRGGLKRRICRISPADASSAGLGEGDIVEVDAYRAAPFRAWVVVDRTVQPGTVPIDAIGLSMLRGVIGERVQVRLLRPSDATPRTGVATGPSSQKAEDKHHRINER
jgi:anaerobic selenocysteine-containing dehydrogenase